MEKVTGSNRLQLELGEQCVRKLLAYLRTLPDQEVKSIYFGGQKFSPTELTREVENGTQVGLEIGKMYLNLLFAKEKRQYGREFSKRFFTSILVVEAILVMVITIIIVKI